MIEKLRSMLDEKRFLHSMGVAELAKDTARRFGADENKAYIAGVLHDCAKNILEQDARRLCGHYGILLNEVEEKNPALIHAPLGAFVARDEFKIADEQILDAIRYHTVGRKKMSKLEKIIYVADMAEPSRDFQGVLDIRQKLSHNLDDAVLAALKFSIEFNIKRDKLIHPGTIDAWNDIKITRESE